MKTMKGIKSIIVFGMFLLFINFVFATAPTISSSLIGAEQLINGSVVAYYSFEGANTSDMSGNGNIGTNNGAIYTEQGRVGGAYSFYCLNYYFYL